MRFVFTMNLPSYKGNLVQQVIGDHDSKSLESLCDTLNNEGFITVAQYYNVIHRNGEREWQYKGQMILNTDHIGKVQEFVAKDAETY